MKFTDRQIMNLKPKTQRYEVYEDRGFGVRVAPSGRKTFIYLYRMPGNSRKRRMTIGSYPAMSLVEAHKKFAESREMVTRGIDPGVTAVKERTEERKAPTVGTLVEEYLQKWARPRKRTWREDQRILSRDVVPLWGDRKAKEITKRDVIRLLDRIMDRGAPIMANRTLAVIRRMFNFAVERDIIPLSPCMAVRAPAQENQRDRVLSAEELKSLWHGLNGAQMAMGTRLALKLMLVTAQRKGEIVSAAWDEIDLIEEWWTIPAEKAKNRLPHRVPLSPLALELLRAAKDLSGESPWVFPSPRGNKHITPEAIDHALRRPGLESLGFTFVPHDLRRTAASHMTSMGISRLVVSKILNHVERGVTAVYDRHSYDQEKRQALEAWGHKLNSIIEGGDEKVIPLVRRIKTDG